MGAWGTGNFDNDTALDWVGAFVNASDPASFLRTTLQAVRGDLDYLDADVCCEALAAAEVVSALRGAPATDLPAELDDWVKHRSVDVAPLVQPALNAISLVRIRSELQELWQETDDDYAHWLAVVENLDGRLRL